MKAKKPTAKAVKEVVKPSIKTIEAKKQVTPKAAAKKPAAPKTEKVLFAVRAEPDSVVYLAGCFNDWDPTAKKMTDKAGDGYYTVTLSLPKGSYEYKFVINGTWCADPECAEWVQNDMGTLNSVKNVL